MLAAIPAGVVPFTDNPLVGANFWTARLTAVKVLGMYFWRLIWPALLSCDYSYSQIPLFGWRFNNWEEWKTLVALVLCAGLVVAAALCYRRSKPLFFLIAFASVSLAPTANLVIMVGTVMAERFLYLPAVGFAGCLVWIAHRTLRTPWAMAAVAVVCLAFCARTFARNGDWLDERSLWTSAVEVCPQSYKAHQHLAVLLAVAPYNDMEGARIEIDKSLAILAPLPDDEKQPAVYATAGACDRAKGDSIRQFGRGRAMVSKIAGCPAGRPARG